MLASMCKLPPACLALLASLAVVLPGVAARKKATPPASKPAPQPVIAAFWHFERDVKPESRGPSFGSAKRVDGAEFFFVEEVPGEFIYDPVQKLSYPNSFSLNFQSEEGHNDTLEIPFDAVKAGLPGQSATLELFFKPDAEWNTPLAMKGRLNDTASEWGLEARYFEQHRQTYLHAFFTGPGKETEHFRGGHYGTSAQVQPDNLGWRHMAIVCDAAAKTLTCYIDYYQAKTIPLPGEMLWDAAPFYIGGGPTQSEFKGKIDEVRLTRAALRPEQLLRARHAPLAGVSFASVETVLPRGSGYIDLKESFGALGDGRTDDTAAFQEAFRVLSNRAPLAHHTLYIPPGTYLVSDTLQSGRSFTVQGAGVEKTVIKLADKTFTRIDDPRPVWRASSIQGAPGSNSAVDGNSTRISIHDLAIDTGKGNLGAKALEYHSNNGGCLENVQLRSGDGAGLVGLDLTHKTNGPALIKNVRVTGFDLGVLTAYQEYSMTIEGLTLEGQRSAGLKNNGNILAIRKLHSTNKVPAILSEGGNSMITLLDSTLQGAAKGMPKGVAAIQSDGGLYALRVETPGYSEAIRKRVLVDEKTRDWKNEVIPGPKIDEYIGDQTVTGHGTPKGALKLVIEDTPAVPWGDIHKDWANVQSFAEMKSGEDWAPAIQAAIDSGARTVYFPPGRYDVASPVHLRGQVERLFGMHNRIARPRTDGNHEPALIFDEPDAKRTVSIERLDLDGLQHASPATLVLKSSNPGRYTNAEGCGKLFMEDVSGADFHFDHPQHVWVRQWNPESHAEGPCIFSRGATIWCLGFETESEGIKLSSEAGAQTEILGALIYPLGEIPADRPIFKNTDSKMAVIYGTSVSRSDHPLHILDAKGEEVKRIGNDQLKWAGSRARMDLFTSDAAAPAAPPTAD
jgi:hypothetical protein